MKILDLSNLSFRNDLFLNYLPYYDYALLLMTDRETKIIISTFYEILCTFF